MMHLPHIHINIRHIRIKKQHYRRCLLCGVLVLVPAHFLIIEWEWLVNVVVAGMFFYDPVIAEAEQLVPPEL